MSILSSSDIQAILLKQGFAAFPIDDVITPIDALIRFVKCRTDENKPTTLTSNGTVVFFICSTDPRGIFKEHLGNPIARFLHDDNQLPSDGCFVIGLSGAHAWKVLDSYKTINDIAVKFQDINIGAILCVEVQFKTKELVIYYDGLAGSQEPIRVVLKNNKLSKDECLRFIGRVAENSFPWKNDFWTDQNKWIVSHNLEKIIHRELLSHLRGYFDDSEVMPVSEATMTDGRTDIWLLGKTENALMELKALRQKSAAAVRKKKITVYYDENHRETIKEGVSQIQAYRKMPRKVDIAILAVFIACKDKRLTIFNEYLPICKQLEIELAWLQMYPNVKIKRQMQSCGSQVP